MNPRPGDDERLLTGCRVSAVVGTCVGHLDTDGVEHDLHVTEKRNQKRRRILLDAARPVLAYVQRAGIAEDKEGPLFRPMTPDATRLIRRHLDRVVAEAAISATVKAAHRSYSQRLRSRPPEPATPC
jgi:hypothetical protein